MLLVYFDEVSDACRGSEDDPLIHRDGLLALVLLDGDVATEEEQGERGHLGAVVQEDLRGAHACHQHAITGALQQINTFSDRERHHYHTLYLTAIL